MLFRLAPTPSGYLHLGNAFSFLLTAAIAKKYNGRILLRIDDLDAERKRPEYVQDIFDSLEWLGIEWQEGPRNAAEFEAQWSQRHRHPLYTDAIRRLTEQGDTFACSCSRKQLQEKEKCRCREKMLPFDMPDTALRLFVPEGTIIDLQDPHLGLHSIDLAEWRGSFIIRRRDGIPAYQLASVVDDLHFGVDYIVRGHDLLFSTASQFFLADKLGHPSFRNVKFLHHTLIPSHDGEKLSKSKDDFSLKMLRDAGKTSEESIEKLAPLITIFLKNFS